MSSPTTPAELTAADADAPRPRRRVWLRGRLSTVDQAMTIGAAILLPLGLVMVFLGWYGAARTPYLFEQVPYLLSGGLLGLGLVMSGGFVLFGSWIARTAREQRTRDLELLAAVRELRSELARPPAEAPVPLPPAQRARRKASGAANGNAPGLVATVRGSMLHRPDCAIVAGRDDLHPVVDPAAEGLQPCRLCDPLGAEPVRA